MPKGSYKNISSAKKNAKKIINKTKCDAIKIEYNKNNFQIIKGLTNEKINVMGHIGLLLSLKISLKWRVKLFVKKKLF